MVQGRLEVHDYYELVDVRWAAERFDVLSCLSVHVALQRYSNEFVCCKQAGSYVVEHHMHYSFRKQQCILS